MRLSAKEVMSIWKEKMAAFPWDEELLDKVIATFDYPPSIDTILYRTADVLSGASKINEDGVLFISAESSITELDISPELYKTCTKAGIITISDISEERCQKVLDIEDYAALTAAMLEVTE